MLKLRSSYIAGPVTDSVFFIFTPWLAYLVAGIGLWLGVEEYFARHGFQLDKHGDAIGGMFVSAHLFAVFFRSHGNPRIFKLYPARFVLAPVLLVCGMLSSKWILVSLSVLATWWDVYHSSLQTFGLGRIYDMKVGNDAQTGRRLDIGMNLLTYAGPILGGATLMDHMNDFNEFLPLGATPLVEIPNYASAYHWRLTAAVIAIALVYVPFYIWNYLRYIRKGYQVSLQKALLYVVTVTTSIYAWGFNSFGEAFFVMNFFHAVQYYAIVWIYEKKTIQDVFRLGSIRDADTRKWTALALFLLVIMAWGVTDRLVQSKSQFMLVLSLTVTLLHFWYDGFIWSVRKNQV